MTMVVKKIDARDFLSKLTKLQIEDFPRAARRGLGEAGIELMRDTIQQEPTAPRDIPAEERGESFHELWGSGAVFVENKKIKGSWYGDPIYQPEQVENPKPMTAQIVFGAPYAAQWHENLPKEGFTYSPAGIKFLENKLIGNISKYAGIIAKELQKAQRRHDIREAQKH